ncbi:MAG: SGNH/GDSL hydrolase family protein [Candidatus Obscuribacterales bacterium]|jgi:lysophospholipase L1-like esterase
MAKFDLYLALGDSMSIDFYPAADAGRDGRGGRETIGAAALFYENDSQLFPDFTGRDLKTLIAAIQIKNLTFDGATTVDLLEQERLKNVPRFDGKTLVTLTIGGNDLLQVMGRKARGEQVDLARSIDDISKRYKEVLTAIRKKVPNSVIILNTVYDPTDGTGILPTSSPLFESELPIKYLHLFNDFIRQCAAAPLLLGDIHKHFEGHGAFCGSADNFWYWKPSPIEPGYRGASEIRRLWLEAIGL